MARLDLECAVIGPQIDRCCDACDSPLEDLVKCQHARHCTTTRAASPSQQPLYRQWRIPGRHISSSTRRAEGIWREIDRRHCVWLQWLAGSSFDLTRPREIPRREQASPSAQSCRDPRATEEYHQQERMSMEIFQK